MQNLINYISHCVVSAAPLCVYSLNFSHVTYVAIINSYFRFIIAEIHIRNLIVKTFFAFE